jgi:hypothetical protein
VAGLLAGVCAIPAVGADEKLPPPTRRELLTSQNNLKQVVLAFHNHAAAYNDVLPNNIYSKDGKALLSWRVVILPYVEELPLYQQFKLDEPWDSEANKKLIEKMPKLYAPVRVKAKEGETFYRMFSGTGILGPKPKYKIANIPDGTSNTGAVFEAAEPVIWTKPGDLPYDPKKPLPKLGGLFDGEAHVAMFDGSVRRLKKDPDETQLRILIEPDDGQVLDWKKLEAK